MGKSIKKRYKKRIHRNRKKLMRQRLIYGSIVVLVLGFITILGIQLVKLLPKSGADPDTTPVSENRSVSESAGVSEINVSQNEPGIEREASISENEITPTSLYLTWEDLSDVGYAVKYRPVLNWEGEHHGKNFTEDGSRSISDICTAVFEGYEDDGIEDESHGWFVKYIREPEIELTGLRPDTEYEIHVFYNEEIEKEYLPAFSITTASEGYCDPFRAIDSFLCVSERDENGNIISKGMPVGVTMSAAKGCLGVEVKPMFNTSLYSGCELNEKLYDVQQGDELHITDNEDGKYCHLSSDGTWTVYVRSADGNEGWVNARALMIDVKGCFSPDNGIYGIQINRTNAVSSIFTAGGNAHSVNSVSSNETRYDSISVNDADYFLNVDGYNVIDNVTGNVLPGYGSSGQMPLVWDMAMELIQCQKNALENGFTLLIYDGYRPASTSVLVSSELSAQGYLAVPSAGTTLAQGFLTDNYYNVSFYISVQSRHNRGIATDLTLMRFNSPGELGDEVTMQTKMHTLDYRCNMSYNTWEADLLTDIMIGHGSNLEYLPSRQEWWHFQLKKEREDLYPLMSKYGYVDFVF